MSCKCEYLCHCAAAEPEPSKPALQKKPLEDFDPADYLLYVEAREKAYRDWLMKGQNFELGKFAVTRLAFDKGYFEGYLAGSKS
jgi:hypothetical protein